MLPLGAANGPRDLFHSLQVRGREGEFVIGHTSAARLGAWTITKGKDRAWRLRTSATRIDRFLVAQRGIGFVAPNGHGFWCFPVKTVAVDAHGGITAELGQPHG